MDLGKLNVKGQNVNVLHEAIHPSHGLVWTDSKAIYLGGVEILQGQVQHQESLKLGEFEEESSEISGDDLHPVKSIHWSSDVGPSICYLCVVHPQHVSVWKVEGKVPKLSFKQVRKLNVQPIPQGCLWNPGRDILCVLSKQQCSFFFKHLQNRGSYAFPPVESGKITCGTWSRDGSQLVVCVGAVLLLYSWTEIDVSISDSVPLAWRIPLLDGAVRSVVSISTECLVCAAELPLESLCKNQDSFVIPEVKTTDQELSSESDVLKPQTNSVSVTDTLLNLPRNPESVIQDTCQLVMIHLKSQMNPRRGNSIGVKAILTPDLLVYEPKLSSVVVGSNSQNLLQVFSIDEDKAFFKVKEILLERDERPKGISSLQSEHFADQTGFLLAVSKRMSNSGMFLPSSNGNEDVRLKFFPLSLEDRNIAAQNKCKTDMNSDNPALSNVTQNFSESQKRTIKLQNENEPLETSHTETSQTESLSLVTQRPATYGASGNNSPNYSPRESVEMLLTKQKTIGELRDYSDSDSSKSSPREITLIKEEEKGPKIIDLNKSDSADSELETETTDFSEHTPNFKRPEIDEYFQESYDTQAVTNISNEQKTEKEVEKTSVVDVHDHSKSESLAASSQIEEMEKEIDMQKSHIESLQQKVESLTKMVEETSLVFPTRYQTLQQPDIVTVVCRCPSSDSKKKKTFLLDNGRIHLETLKEAFNLSLVELYIDGDACVIGSNIDGYIPMRFAPSSTIEIGGKAQIGDTSSEDLGIEELDRDL